jgi:DNA-binding PadR family transcriptional regulator
MSTSRLSNTSYLVLGLVEGLEGATPYDLKQMVSMSLGYFWSFPHSQLYSEPDRLVKLALLEVEQEQGGRRRKRYTITESGHEALQEWLQDPEAERMELRDAGLLKLFFGELAGEEDITRLAQARAAACEQELKEYEKIEQDIADVPDMRYPYATLRLGIACVRTFRDFWADVAEGKIPG